MASGGTWRKDFLGHADYWMAVASLASQRSRDPKTQVGACIVNQENDIVGIGYNRMPKGCDDDQMPWNREGNQWATKYPYVCSAVLDAVMNKNGADLKGCTIYVTLLPCNESDKLIIQAGIKKVVYLSDQYRDAELMAASRSFLKWADIECIEMTPKRKKIIIDLEIKKTPVLPSAVEEYVSDEVTPSPPLNH